MRKILFYIFCSIPILLISGPFLSGVAVSTIALYGLYCLQFLDKIRKNKILKNFIIISFLFYIYINIISYHSFYPEESFKSSLLYIRFILFSLGSYFIISDLKENAYTFIGYIIIFSFLIVFISLIVEILFNFYSFKLNTEDQLTGIFFTEKIAGSFIAKLYPLGFGIIYFCNFKHIKISKKNLIKTFFLISLFSVLLSGERTSIAIFFISNIILLFGLNIYRESILDIKNLILIAFSILFLSFIANNVFDRVIFNSISQITEGNKINIISKHHESHLKTAYKMFENNKILGVGPRMYRFLCDERKYEYIWKREIQYDNAGSPKKLSHGKINLKDYNGCSTHPHNLFFQILSESGLIGISFYLFFLFFVYFQLSKFLINKKQNISKNKIMPFVILTSLFSVFFPFFPSNNFFGSYVNIFYYFILTFYFVERNETS